MFWNIAFSKLNYKQKIGVFRWQSTRFSSHRQNKMNLGRLLRPDQISRVKQASGSLSMCTQKVPGLRLKSSMLGKILQLVWNRGKLIWTEEICFTEYFNKEHPPQTVEIRSEMLVIKVFSSC